MAYYSTNLESALTLAYVRRYGVREHDVLKQCRLETLKSRPNSGMMTMPEEASFLAFFIKSLGFTRGLEIGVYTGYSSIAIAMAMPDDGELVCCEIDQEVADIARSYWQQAGVSDKVKCHVGNAVDTLTDFIAAGEKESFDFIYIDADKEQYDKYYELALTLLRPTGIIILDNMLWGGKVLDKTDVTESTLAIKNLNQKIHKDQRVEISFTAMGDGVTFVRKK